MRFKKYESIIIGVIFLVIAAVYGSQIPNIKISNFAPINSAFFPKLCCVILAVLALQQLINGVRTLKSNWAEGDEADKTDYMCVAQTFGMTIVYVALLDPLGFIISSIIYLFFQISILCPKAEFKPIKFLIISVITSLVIFVVFKNGLGLMLPRGILKGLI